MTSKDKTNAFAVIQGILAESGPAGFYKGVQVTLLCACLAQGEIVHPSAGPPYIERDTPLKMQ